MNKKSLIIAIIMSLSFGVIGYVLGINHENIFTNQYREHEEAYKKGWSHWFSGYGMTNEGMAYIQYYEFGRKYGSDFDNTYEAFKAGYMDGFYYVNHKELNEKDYIIRINNGYLQYYSDEYLPQ